MRSRARSRDRRNRCGRALLVVLHRIDGHASVFTRKDSAVYASVLGRLVRRGDNRVLDLFVNLRAGVGKVLEEVIRLVEGDVAELGVEVYERAGSTTDNITVRIGTARRCNTVSKTFAVEVAGEDSVFHSVVGTVVISIQYRLEIVDSHERRRLVGYRVGYLLCL